jgi:hypothetical protein
MVEQLAGLASVLAGDQLHLAEHAHGAIGDVFQVADGCRDHIQPAGHVFEYAAKDSGNAESAAPARLRFVPHYRV